MLGGLLARPWAWWLNKAPLSVTLVLLLIDGRPLDVAELAALVLVVMIVCAVGNYGYALNDLFDIEEDLKTGAANWALSTGRGRAAWVIFGSAALAVVLAWAAAGALGAGVTLIELMLPLAYSIPPLRLKERKWLGVMADALAAHVYPAGLALLAVRRLDAGAVSATLAACVLAWSAAAGLRGILSHQLHTAERDVRGGLRTVVHDLGREPLGRFVVWILLPVEAGAFIGAVAASTAGPVLWACGALYLACELYRTLDRRFTVRALRPEGQRYLPLVEESFYKAWGPIVIALDAARVDPKYLAVPLLYGLLFRLHMQLEAGRLSALWTAVARAPKAG